MKTQHILTLAALACLCLSCNDWYTEHQLGHDTVFISDTRSMEYTLSKTDYGKIASLEDNKALALTFDDDSLTYRKLLAIADLGFLPDSSARSFVPALLPHCFPQLTSGALVTVTLKNGDEQPSYFGDFFARIKEVTVADKDYKAADPDAKLIVYYDPEDPDDAEVFRYFRTEPDVNALLGVGAENSMVVLYWREALTVEVKALADLKEHADVFVMHDGVWEPATAGSDLLLALPLSFYEGEAFVSTPSRVLPPFVNASVSGALDGDLAIVLYRGASGMVPATLSFDTDKWKLLRTPSHRVSFLSTDSGWVQQESLYFSEPCAVQEETDKNLLIQNVLLTGSLSYIWKFDSRYGMKASAYVGGNHASESWLITAPIDLTAATEPVLVFDHTSRYAADFVNELSVQVTTGFEDDVNACDWTHIPFLKNDDGSWLVPSGADWTFISSGKLSLKEFAGKDNVRIAFRYTSTDAASATWEVKNIKVMEQ